MFFLSLLLACPQNVSGPDKSGDTDETGVDSGDSGDSGDSEITDDRDTGTPAPDSEGPSPPACTPAEGDGTLVALSGVLLTPDGPEAGVLVYSRSNGLITCVGPDCDTGGATVVCTEGVISPGLIDAHNHLQYNSLPPWQVDPEFIDRYEWRSDDRYYDYRTAYDAIKDDWSCEIDKWAELRELLHGTTAAVGSYGDDCIDVLIRNLDEGSSASGISGYSLEYSASTVTDSVNADDGAYYRSQLDAGSIDGVLNHVAEARDGVGRSEIDWMFEAGMTGPGQGYVHSADASTTQLAQMAADGTAIVWSPRSNLALYGTTTPIEVADRLGVPWAIGTDWTPSGSMAPTRELACAAEWLGAKGNPVSDVRLWEKVTTDAARIVGLDGVLGQLVEGMKADVAVYSWDAHPYRHIIQSEPEDVLLVVVDGQALYGRTDWLDGTAEHPEWCEAVEVCGEARSACVKAASSGGDAQTMAEIGELLQSEMDRVTMPSGYDYAAELFPLYTCGEERPSCDLSAPTDGDRDGDGVADELDLCPNLYDPLQWDTDGDGIGDVCDPCAINAYGTDCTPEAGDRDGDGVADGDDNCPEVGNPDQADRDADEVGDACDACPDLANPDGAGCPVTVQALQDEGHADHPDEGAIVTVSGLVVTAVQPEGGYYAQDPAGGPWSAVYVYDAAGDAAEEGDVIEATGTYTEFYDFTELAYATVVVTGSAAVPAAEVVDPCDVGTSGAEAEAYESVLLRVEGVAVTDNAPDSGDYREWVLDGCLRVDDAIYTSLAIPDEGDEYASVTGVLTYSFSNFKLLPRRAADVVE